MLAHALRDRGVGTDSVVAVALPRTAEFVVALFAVWRAGGVYLPLDLEHPTARLRDVIDDAAPVVVLTTADHAAEFGDHTAAADDLARRAEQLDTTTDFADPAPQHGAYLIYTSGSTGRPKGVQIDHGALAHLLAAHRHGMYGETAARVGDRPLRVAHTTSFAFDASLDPLLWLLDGHRIH
ncbi:AMP-binding protein, partial [Nocardia gipuzkoensis]